jgi:cyclic-di-GMP phosphodiesterase TipF (flagellum assembly factor)
MRRLATFFVAVFMVAIAGSAAVVLNRQLGFSLVQSAVFAAGILFALVLVNLLLQRRSDRRWLEQRVTEIATVAADAAEDAERMHRRVRGLESELANRVRRETEPLAAEIEMLGTLLQQVADTLVAVDARVDTQLAPPPPRVAPPPPPRVVELAPPPQPAPIASVEPVPATPKAAAETPPPAPRPAREPVRQRPETSLEDDIDAAIRDEAIEIHLQPIVSMPQRKVRFYEVLPRLRRPGGEMLLPEAYLPIAEKRRIVARHDTFVVIRAMQILKRLAGRSRDVGLFVDLSGQSLLDPAFFREFHSFLSASRGFADLMVFEFADDFVRGMSPIEEGALAAVSEMGFRFSVAGLADLRLDFHALSGRGFRFAKIDAGRLLRHATVPLGDIHAEDLGGHLARQGVELIVDGLEREIDVVELLEHDIRFAQGNLFSVPRPVRSEAMAPAVPKPAAEAPRRAVARASGMRGTG